MRRGLLLVALLAGAPAAPLLAASCGGESLPTGEYPFDSGIFCADGSAPIPINAVECPLAACTGGTAYAICTGTVYGACSCKGGSGVDAAMMTEAPMTGTEGGGPDVSPAETGPTETGPTDMGPPDMSPGDTGHKDSGRKDSGSKDAGAKDMGPPDLGPPDMGPAG